MPIFGAQLADPAQIARAVPPWTSTSQRSSDTCCEASPPNARDSADRFTAGQISWAADGKRQRIVDSWPADVDDTAARHDWGFSPRYDFRRAFSEYLIPTIRQRYA